MPPKPGLEFGNLPLIEAAVRATSPRPVTLTYRLVNAIADELRSTLPVLSEPKQLEVAPGAGVSPIEFGPAQLPGAVYTDPKSNLSVSLHPQVIVARWAKPTALEAAYPRYGPLRSALWIAVEALRKSSGDGFPGLAVVNMSYVNFIPTPDSAGVLTTFFRAESRVEMMTAARQVRKLEGAWRADSEEELDLRFALEQVTARLGDRVQEGYRLTTAAGIRLSESLNAKDALDKVHDELQMFFLRLISDTARAQWQLKENSIA